VVNRNSKFITISRRNITFVDLSVAPGDIYTITRSIRYLGLWGNLGHFGIFARQSARSS